MHSLLFGGICVWVALAGAISSLILYGLVQAGMESLRGWARLSYVMVAQGVIWAVVHLMYLVLHHRFEVGYVAEYSSRELPSFYLVSSFWAGQQGTFFLWSTYTAILGVLFMTRCRRSLEPLAMMVLAGVEVFLMLFEVVASPFALSPPNAIPPDGQGLNILLQNHWMVIHPPIMFLGFASMAFPFAIGIAALLRREYDDWIGLAWPWVVFAWCALGCGLFMGGYWAYTVLGWGGFWGWDNVENASLVPWLATTALLHGMMVQRSRGSMKRANLLFALSPFVMVVYGSFLTRSGILADFSVHSFAAPDKALYYMLLAFLCVVTLLAAVVFLARVASISRAEAFEEEASRGFYFVIGTWLIYAASLIVLVGTSWPLLSQVSGHPANVTQSFYNHWLFPVAILVCVAMGISPFLKWRGRPAESTPRILRASAAGALLLTLALTVANASLYQQSMQAPADARVRTNPSAYQSTGSPQPSGAVLNGRTTAAGAVTPAGKTDGTVTASNGQQFQAPDAPQSLGSAYIAALHMPNGAAYPIFIFAALFCMLSSILLVWQTTGGLRRNWLAAGGFVSHIGLALLLTGVIISMNYGGDAILSLDPGTAVNSDNSVAYSGGQSIAAFGHTFTFSGYRITADQHTAIMQVHVQGAQGSFVAEPRITMAQDGNMVHFPAIRKYLMEDLYVSPIKLPGMGQMRSFHAVIELRDGRHVYDLRPGLAFGDSGPTATDAPSIPDSGYQLVLQDIRIPAHESGDTTNTATVSLVKQGTIQTTTGSVPTVQLNLGESGSLGNYTVRYVSSSMDPNTSEMQKEVASAQIEVSTKPFINLVWLGTFLLVLGGLLAWWRRYAEDRRF
jgi:cytochrome c-type biogenesis protein CcmF